MSDQKKSVDILDHKFLYTAFHPTMSDHIICLEHNTYPKGQNCNTIQEPQNWFIGQEDLEDQSLLKKKKKESKKKARQKRAKK